jgi:hypothetical protein
MISKSLIVKFEFYIVIWSLLCLKYGLITFSFIPLFIVILVRINKYFPDLYSKYKIGLISLFTCYLIFIIFRILFYIFIPIISNVNGIDVQLPLYISEILLIIVVCAILITASKTNEEAKGGIGKENNKGI